MPKISSYSLSDSATRLSPPSGLNDADKVKGLFVPPSTPTIGLGESDTAFANTVQIPSDSATVSIDAADAPYAILDTGETHTLVVIWSGSGL